MRTYCITFLLFYCTTTSLAQSPQPVREIHESFNETTQQWELYRNAYTTFGYSNYLDDNNDRLVTEQRNFFPTGKPSQIAELNYYANGVVKYSNIKNYNYVSDGENDFTNTSEFVRRRTIDDQGRVTQIKLQEMRRNGATNEMTKSGHQTQNDYDENGCIAETRRFFLIDDGADTLAVLPDTRQVLSHNDNCLLMQRENFSWSSFQNEWNLSSIDHFRYDAQDRLIETRYLTPDGVDRGFLYTCEYTSTDTTSVQTCIIADANNDPSRRTTEIFDRNDLLIKKVRELYVADEMEWRAITEENYQYDNLDRLIYEDYQTQLDIEKGVYLYMEYSRNVYREEQLISAEIFVEDRGVSPITDSIVVVSKNHYETLYQYACDGRLTQIDYQPLTLIKRGVEVSFPLQRRKRYQYLEEVACNDLPPDLMMQIYPNPTRDFVRVVASDYFARTNTQVYLLSANGAILYHTPVRYAYENRIPLYNLPIGVYFIRIIDGDNSFVEKIVKH